MTYRNEVMMRQIEESERRDPTPYPYTRRHPCQVTSDRLAAHLEQYPDTFDGIARDAIGQLRYLLEKIADGK